MLKIAFLTTIRSNIGDDFVRNGIRAVLDRIGIPYSSLLINKHDVKSLYQPCEDETERVEDKLRAANLLIQAGAPVYWSLQNGSCSINSEWHQWFWLDRVFRTSEPRLLNLGAGTCQPCGDEASLFLKHEDCVAFTRRLAERSELTTVRDRLASRILDHLACPHLLLPCPAFLSAERAASPRLEPSLICVNWMPLGAHYDLDNGFPTDRWLSDIKAINHGLRRLGRLLFVAHDLTEVEFMEPLLAAGERIFHAASWRDYQEIYGSSALVVANRVHGAMVAAGHGVPAILLGNDTRAEVADLVGVSRFRAARVNPEEVLSRATELTADRKSVSDSLLRCRELALHDYAEAVAPHLEQP